MGVHFTRCEKTTIIAIFAKQGPVWIGRQAVLANWAPLRHRSGTASRLGHHLYTPGELGDARGITFADRLSRGRPARRLGPLGFPLFNASLERRATLGRTGGQSQSEHTCGRLLPHIAAIRPVSRQRAEADWNSPDFCNSEY